MQFNHYLDKMASINCNFSINIKFSPRQIPAIVISKLPKNSYAKIMTELNELCSNQAVTHCEPLYLSEPFLKDGHSKNKANGTITYIKHRGAIYGVTCAHVFNYQFDSDGNQTHFLTVFGDRIIYRFGNYSENGYKNHFKLLKKADFSSTIPDIAIIRLDEPFPEIYLQRKGKVPIDLDQWVAPDFSSIETCIAYGYPTEHKEQSESHVAANLCAVQAELTRPLSPSEEKFMLASTVENNTSYFSGMSGGPVCCLLSNNNLTLLGIIFEGSPGSSAEWNKRETESFYGKEHVQIHAYMLTPTIFDEWLDSAGFKHFHLKK